jgi:hypothetical protein
MSNLRDLFPDTRFNLTYPTNAFGVLSVYNGNQGNAVSDGGRCCLWTVPTGAVWAKFEVWGGGGDGPGACCCQQPSRGGGSGSYARRTIRVTPGQTFTICAGGSGCCSQPCRGTNGFPSYACNASATPSALCLCASGGAGGESSCFWAIASCFHCPSHICGSTCNADFAICGLMGSAHASWCGFDAWHMVPGGPVIGAGARISRTHCGEYWMGCQASEGNANQFPGGGGGGAMSYNGPCCWGGWGSGGMVVVTYK